MGGERRRPLATSIAARIGRIGCRFSQPFYKMLIRIGLAAGIFGDILGDPYRIVGQDRGMPGRGLGPPWFPKSAVRRVWKGRRLSENMRQGPWGFFMKQLVLALIAAVTMLGSLALAQLEHGHGGHVASGDVSMPQAAGQDAFAAIAEIVRILDRDPKTDWSHVDIGALQRHLMDMDAIVTQASATEESIPDGLRMRIARGGAGGTAAQRMVPAHAPFLKEATGWMSTTDVDDDQIVWTVTATSGADVTKIRALGFYGLLATGAHHQRHHLAIARGETMH